MPSQEFTESVSLAASVIYLLPTLYSAAELEKKEAEFEDSRLREYHCPVCDKDLHLSSIGILRHKRMHAKMK